MRFNEFQLTEDDIRLKIKEQYPHLTDEQIDRFTDMILDLRDKVKAKKKWKNSNLKVAGESL